MKYSIQTKLFMTVSLIITFFIVILVCSHLLFYGKYTIRQYEVMLTDAYNTVSK